MSQPLSRVILSMAAEAILVISLAGACSGFGTAQKSRASDANPQITVEGTPVSEEMLARGARLYSANCQVCHGDKDGEGRHPYVPSHGNDGHTWQHSDRNLLDIIMNGTGEMGEMMRRMSNVPEDAPRMPAWKDKLSDDEVRAILAYIKTFWTPERRRMQVQSPMMP